MISLEQVHALESRVEKAVALIASLRTENASLRSGLDAATARVTELEGLVSAFQKDQAKIEEGILLALRKLDSFEDAVHQAQAAPEAATAALPSPKIVPPAAMPKAAEEEPVPAAVKADEAESDGLDIF